MQKISVFLACVIILLLIVILLYKEFKKARLNGSCVKFASYLILEKSKNADIVLLGDSRVKEWKSSYFQKNINIVNLGFPGATSHEVLCCLTPNILKIRPNWFVVQVGINDIIAASMVAVDKKEQIHIDLLNNLRKINDKLTGSKANVLFLTLVPPISPDILRKALWGREVERDVEKISTKILQGFLGASLVFDAKNVFYNYKHHRWRDEYVKDALHWNERGYLDLTEQVEKIILEEKQH